ncbi:MAG: response regulator transcription factor [Oscillospiraceae bacterium]|jgi:DNA-binding response OmpR family regulator|nr:response regulator transcription factor [Oscillospiraceae bacterium]
MPVQQKILVVDDDSNICELLRLYLEKEGYEVLLAFEGNAAVRICAEKKPALVLLDIMLPVFDGWQVCREIRKTSQVPIIMLTAKSEIFDKVLGLELGADDYVTKPFDTKEIVARVKAVLRRTEAAAQDLALGAKAQVAPPKEVCFEKLSVNLGNYELHVDGKRVDAPPKELELLFYLASNPNRVFTRNQLLDEVWGFDYYGDSRTIDVHVKRLREKLEGVSAQWSLQTVWSVGYKFAVGVLQPH